MPKRPSMMDSRRLATVAGSVGVFGITGILPKLAGYYHFSIAKVGWLLLLVRELPAFLQAAFYADFPPCPLLKAGPIHSFL